MTLKNLYIATFFLTALIAKAQVSISHKPMQPLNETVDGRTVSNFDLIIENAGQDTLSITKVLVRMFDEKNQLLKEKFLDNNGTAPSINLLSKKDVLPGKVINVFNPFPEMVGDITHKLEYTFTFNDNQTMKHSVSPMDYVQKISFTLPVTGRNLVYDGHDCNSHHRRFDYEFAPIKQLGFTSNFMRYAYDFVSVNEAGQMHINDGSTDTEWFSFGKDIIAVADGTIVSVVTAKADDKKFDIGALKNDQMELFGNYVVIKHNDKLYSVYGHMQQNSSSLKVGDKVVRGQKIGRIGTSGSAFMPHLHFEMRDGNGPNAEGLPSYFSDFSIILGNQKQFVKNGTINTGDIFISEKK